MEPMGDSVSGNLDTNNWLNQSNDKQTEVGLEGSTQSSIKKASSGKTTNSQVVGRRNIKKRQDIDIGMKVIVTFDDGSCHDAVVSKLRRWEGGEIGKIVIIYDEDHVEEICDWPNDEIVVCRVVPQNPRHLANNEPSKATPSSILLLRKEILAR